MKGWLLNHHVFHSCTHDVVWLRAVYQQTHAWRYRLNLEAKPNNNNVNILSVSADVFVCKKWQSQMKYGVCLHSWSHVHKPLTPCKISGRRFQSRSGDAPGSHTEAEITLWLCLYERENIMRWETVCAGDSVWSWPKMLMQCK